MGRVHVTLTGQHRPQACHSEIDGLTVGDACVVDLGGRTLHGVVVRLDPDEEAEAGPAGMPRVLRRAAGDDEASGRQLEERRRECLDAARRRADELHLPMRFVRCEVSPGSRRVMLFFVAETRVDFRQLVRDLARDLRGRVELRQIGVRDAAIHQGGIGHCSRPLCCSTFLPSFAPVSMRMAKLQGLPVNPVKISGQCGRLMCCLRYEIDAGDDAPRASGPPRRRDSRGNHARGGDPENG